MSDYIDVRWQVEDGYAGKSRPQYTRIYPEDFVNYETVAEIVSGIEEAIQEDFVNKIWWAIGCDLDKVAEDALAKIKEMRENE